MYNKYRKDNAAAQDRLLICILTIIIMCLIWAGIKAKTYHETTTNYTNNSSYFYIPTQG